MDVIKKLLI